MKRILTLMVVGSLTACTFGPRVERAAVAAEPRGANVRLEMTGGNLWGELLAVRDTGLVLLSDGPRVVLAPYAAIRRIEPEIGEPILRGRRPPTEGERQRLRLLSRFPQGLDPALERALLRAYGQGEIEGVGR